MPLAGPYIHVAASNNALQRTRQTVSDFANTKIKIAAGLPRR